MRIKTLDEFTNRVNEAKGDNLHQFVKYMNEYGKQGELKHCSTTAEKEFSKNNFVFSDVSDTFDNYSLCGLVFDYLCDMGEACDWDEVRDSDDPVGEYIEDENDFNGYLMDVAYDRILSDLETDSRGNIYIEREISVPKFINKDKFYDLLKTDYDGKLGVFWTYRKGNAEAQWSKHPDGEYIRLYGYVSPTDVDWDETIRANLDIPDEQELTLKKGATIELNRVKTKKGHTIFRGSMLYKA